MIAFKTLFCSTSAEKDKFLSRLFGIFNETIVRIWCRQQQAEFEDLGRPRLTKRDTGKGLTLDFTLRSRKDGRLYIGEMKCELEFQCYKYLTLTESAQLNHHTKPAFQWFLSFAKNPEPYTVTVKCEKKKKEINPSGVILIWGCVTEEGRQAVWQESDTRKVSDVLSLEKLVADLQAWRSEEYNHFLSLREQWCQELFSNLRGG